MLKTPRLLAVVLLLLAPLAAVVAIAGPAQAGPAFQQPSVGECRALTMAEFSRASNNEAAVECSQPHTSRVIATGRLPRDVSWSAPLRRLNRIAVRICDPAWKSALGTSYSSRAMTAYTWGWFIPTKAQRDRGARWIRCDLVLMGGKALVRLPTDNEPALTSPPHPNRIAACLTLRSMAYTTCARRHGWRATGTFVIRQKAHPTDRQFRRAALRRCPSRVSTRSFAWDDHGPDRWRLGDHVVICFSRTRR
ncbi:septum formation family protein [Nocardioides sp.]|uniref:septum formation family protein n=1 Tax=Nocardioides sp. TaxID=35761 RepID=UPI002D802FF0|nr:septum formation family protein [Nocardioides sp.]HET8961516.1 septum formation family protein [Nocardioides sp.]